LGTLPNEKATVSRQVRLHFPKLPLLQAIGGYFAKAQDEIWPARNFCAAKRSNYGELTSATKLRIPDSPPVEVIRGTIPLMDMAAKWPAEVN
jgi:hypothetical protein